jgi:hypothetical protein
MLTGGSWSSGALLKCSSASRGRSGRLLLGNLDRVHHTASLRLRGSDIFLYENRGIISEAERCLLLLLVLLP